MDEGPPVPPATQTADPLTDRLLPLLAVGVIALSLALLVVVPLLVQRRSNAIWQEIRSLESAGEQARQWSFALTREMSLLRGYVVEGDTILLRLRQENREAEAETRARLVAATSSFPPPVQDQLGTALDLVEEWHRLVDAELATAGPDPRDRSPTEQVFARPVYEAALDATFALRAQIGSAATAEVQRLSRADRSAMRIELILALFALFATGLVVWIGLRLRDAVLAARRLHQEALHANVARSRLLRGVSHDLKNPLGAADLNGQLIESGALGPLTRKQSEALRRLRGAIGQGIDLVNDLGELGRAESGRLHVAPRPVAIGELVRSVEDGFAARVQNGRLALDVSSAGEGMHALTDPVRMRQILENLVGNAINYTPPDGQIRVEAERCATGPHGVPGDWIAISVTDTGPGIAAEHLEHVFEEFVRLPGTAANAPGSGIGLAISRHLARSMHGEITLRSEVGCGSTFTLWVPALHGGGAHGR